VIRLNELNELNESKVLNLLPYPRSLKRERGFYLLPKQADLQFHGNLPWDTALAPVAERLRAAMADLGVELTPLFHDPRSSGREEALISIHRPTKEKSEPPYVGCYDLSAPPHAEGYALDINLKGISIHYREAGGLRAALATLRQLLREHGRRLPRLSIRDYPDFPRRGVMLDISRGRVPKLETLLELADHLADFKINELQLYIEHTFAYRKYQAVWKEWGAISGQEVRRLDARCRELGIDLVPNQNSFGHMRYWLDHPPLKKLAEVSEPYKSPGGDFLRYPATLAPNHPGTLPFLRGLYGELLSNFTSERFNVGCDEPWDLGRGQSKRLCQARGKGRVYADFLKQIHREVTRRGRRMMFWGDIIIRHPRLLRELPRDMIPLNWGYEANHPFRQEARHFAESDMKFYVCPGTSTWMTLIGRHDNALANLCSAARAGVEHGAAGYLITDWGDGGHPQPLAVSYLPYLAGAALSWCGRSYDEPLLVPVLSRDVFKDPTQRIAKAAFALGLAHRKFSYREPNLTPFGAVIAAPQPALREMACRDGLKYYARIPPRNVRAALEEVFAQQAVFRKSRPGTPLGQVLKEELDLAARMAAQSCEFMLWQQAVAAGNDAVASKMARSGIRGLRKLREDFDACWPGRNKGTTAKCSAFLGWRLRDYERGG
jgi:hypothetical protein